MKATSDIELLVRLDRGSPVPLHLQLERRLREAVRSGQLRPGTALPSTRVLAGELAVARGVVSNAYTQLTAEGYLVSRRGSATRVGEQGTAPAPPAERTVDPARPPRFDLRPGTPDAALFPRQAWANAAAHAIKTAPDDRFGYPDPQGTVELRTELAGYLGRVRGVVADPSSTVITSGVAQGLTLITRALLKRGITRIALEDPGTGPVQAQLAAAGMEPVAVPVDEEGLDVDALERSGARVVLVTPAHQFPTGVVLSPARRARLLEWDGLVLEDDYDAA